MLSRDLSQQGQITSTLEPCPLFQGSILLSFYLYFLQIAIKVSIFPSCRLMTLRPLPQITFPTVGHS